MAVALESTTVPTSPSGFIVFVWSRDDGTEFFGAGAAFGQASSALSSDGGGVDSGVIYKAAAVDPWTMDADFEGTVDEDGIGTASGTLTVSVRPVGGWLPGVYAAFGGDHPAWLSHFSVEGGTGSSSAYMGFTIPDGPSAEIEHCDAALGRLAAQFQDSTKLRDVICVFVDDLQDQELTGAQLLAGRSLDDAMGIQLDKLGQALGEKREGFGDTFYRRVLKGKALAMSCAGQPNAVIAVLEAMTDDVFHVQEKPAAGVRFVFAAGSSMTTPEAERIIMVLRKALPLTVRGIIEYDPPDVTPLFGWEDDPDAGTFAEYGETDAGAGYWVEATDGQRNVPS